jgi:S-adenosylmethionine synthetase
MTIRKFFTSESVTEGHPDKVADQISDGILDAILTADPTGRVAVEVLTTGNRVFIGGEITTVADITAADLEQIARDVIARIEYDDVAKGLDYRTAEVQVVVGQQSPDIADGVDHSLEVRSTSSGSSDALAEADAHQGAGDQGLMFGYATNETAALMPVAIQISHELARRLAQVRHDGTLPYLRPDGKTQVTVVYENDVPVAVDTIVISTQHDDDVELAVIQDDLHDHVIVPVLANHLNLDVTGVKELINPSGRFVIGGPTGDAGLTGRKIIVDTYGGAARHGGGAFSGKDPSKVDRSAAYAMRWVARNVVAAGLASRCEVQVSYAIGRAEPIAVYVDTFGTAADGLDDASIAAAISAVFGKLLYPAAITRRLQLTDQSRVQYSPVAAYGHLGRIDLDQVPTWEQDDMVESLRAAVGR